MELKVQCFCGQKYKFDVEPVNGRMPFAVNCPVCTADGTPMANQLLSQMPMAAPAPVMAAPAMVAAAPPPAPIAAMAPAGLRINKAATPPPVAPPMPAPAAPAARRPGAATAPAVPKYMKADPTTQNNNFLLGVVGAIFGAIVAVGSMIGLTMLLGFTLGYFAIAMGAMIGFGARLMYRGTSSTLGAMAALIAFFTIGGTLLLTVGVIGILLSVIVILIGTATAFKVAS